MFHKQVNIFRFFSGVIMKSIKIWLMPQDTIVLPFAHSSVLQGLVYALLAFEPEYASALHSLRNGNKDAMKLFCFSDLQGRYKIVKENKTLIFTDRCMLEIRAFDDKAIDIIEQRLQSDPCFSLNNYECRSTVIETSTRSFFDNFMAFSANSPITVYKSDGKHSVYYSFEDAEFYELVKNNLKAKYALVYGEEYNDELHFECLRADEKSKCITRYKDTIITGYYGDYMLKADPKMLELAYYCGVGSKNSMGFGFVQC